MLILEDEVRLYVKTKLYQAPELENYLADSSILAKVYENGRICDILVLLDNQFFESEFVPLHGRSFVVDDHLPNGNFFTKVKSYDWMEKDLSDRLPIALWILENSLVIQDEMRIVTDTIKRYETKFSERLEGMLSKKYLELRGERHNLRSYLDGGDELGALLIKSAFVKLAFELCLLSEVKTYPFRAELPRYTRNNYRNGLKITDLCSEFMKSPDGGIIIKLSDEIINEVVSAIASAEKGFTESFFRRWWLYL